MPSERTLSEADQRLCGGSRQIAVAATKLVGVGRTPVKDDIVAHHEVGSVAENASVRSKNA